MRSQLIGTTLLLCLSSSENEGVVEWQTGNDLFSNDIHNWHRGLSRDQLAVDNKIIGGDYFDSLERKPVQFDRHRIRHRDLTRNLKAELPKLTRQRFSRNHILYPHPMPSLLHSSSHARSPSNSKQYSPPSSKYLSTKWRSKREAASLPHPTTSGPLTTRKQLLSLQSSPTRPPLSSKLTPPKPSTKLTPPNPKTKPPPSRHPIFSSFASQMLSTIPPATVPSSKSPMVISASSPSRLPLFSSSTSHPLTTSSPPSSALPLQHTPSSFVGNGGIHGNRHRAAQKNRGEASYIGITIGSIIGIVLLIAVIVVILITILAGRKKKTSIPKKSPLEKRPRKMECANLSAIKFQHGGALVLDSRLRGPVKHACDNQQTVSLKTVQFDSKLNEIVDIGSNIEVVNEKGTTTTGATEVDSVVDKKMVSKVSKAPGDQTTSRTADEKISPGTKQTNKDKTKPIPHSSVAKTI